jgi:hypothetical protein
MIASIAFTAVLCAAFGFAGGAYLACRYAWPKRLYAALFAARP